MHHFSSVATRPSLALSLLPYIPLPCGGLGRRFRVGTFQGYSIICLMILTLLGILPHHDKLTESLNSSPVLWIVQIFSQLVKTVISCKQPTKHGMFRIVHLSTTVSAPFSPPYLSSPSKHQNICDQTAPALDGSTRLRGFFPSANVPME